MQPVRHSTRPHSQCGRVHAHAATRGSDNRVLSIRWFQVNWRDCFLHSRGGCVCRRAVLRRGTHRLPLGHVSEHTPAPAHADNRENEKRGAKGVSACAHAARGSNNWVQRSRRLLHMVSGQVEVLRKFTPTVAACAAGLCVRAAAPGRTYGSTSPGATSSSEGCRVAPAS